MFSFLRGVDIFGGLFFKPSYGGVTLVKGSGNDFILTGFGNDSIDAGEGNNTVNAGFGNNMVKAGSGHDFITTYSGNDTIDAGNGNNWISAGDGTNVVKAGSGNDTILSGWGNDTIDAGDGCNTINAGEGNNVVDAGSGNDSIITGCGDDLIDAGNGNNWISSGSGNDTIVTGTGCDTIFAGFGDDKVFSGAGGDFVDAGFGNDLVKAGSGNDVVFGGAGNDTIFGDGPFEALKSSFDFSDAAGWSSKLSANKTVLDLDGATLTAGGGFFSSWYGLSVQSPSDPSFPGYVREIDAYNDTPEKVSIAFDNAQTRVSLTLDRIFNEKVYVLEQEKCDIKVTLQDGSSVNVTVAGTALSSPGTLDVVLDTSMTGGKLIMGIELTPSLDVPAGTPVRLEGSYGATHPFSEFTIKAISYDADANASLANNDCLKGDTGNDVIDGGYGNDVIDGGSGCDTLTGGQGNNSLTGGWDRDTFAFDNRSTGVNTIEDFNRCDDKLSFKDGVSVISTKAVGCDFVLTLNNGGTIILEDTKPVSDWHMLV